jgi:hypothetical protein
MSNLSVSKVQRKTENDPWPTLGESFGSHPLLVSTISILVNLES